MDIHQLRVFLAAADYRSFSKAASAVFLTQSGVSYQISTMESNLGFKLFHRGTPRGDAHRGWKALPEGHPEAGGGL